MYTPFLQKRKILWHIPSMAVQIEVSTSPECLGNRNGPKLGVCKYKPARLSTNRLILREPHRFNSTVWVKYLWVRDAPSGRVSQPQLFFYAVGQLVRIAAPTTLI